MSELTRRRLIRLAGASFAAAAAGPLAAPRVLGQAKPRLVVIGGGPGGGTVARYVARDARGAIDVTLIEPQARFTTCFFSNLYVGGFRSFESITHGYDKVKADGIRVIEAAATAIDRDRKEVVVGGSRVGYDRLVVAPGIDLKWDSVPGYSEAAAEAMPHAWKAGAQTQLLVRRLHAVRDGETIVMIAPPNPYRCPPGPYERASMFAHVLKSKGFTRAKIVILDTKSSFSKQPLFMEGWEKHFPGMIEWQDPSMHGGIKAVDPATNEVRTDLATYKAALVNVIPAQTAGTIALAAGLADQSGFCPIDPETMKSRMDANIFVVGDACIPGDMPKSAFSANSQAKVAAMVIRGELTGARTFPARYSNTCWSLITTDDDIKIGGTYEPGEGKIKQVTSFVSQKGEPPEVRKQNYQESLDWYAGITAEMFG